MEDKKLKWKKFSMEDLIFSIYGKKKHQSLRPGCCGKKRKSSQCYWTEGYDGGAWKCIKGFGCKKTTLI